MDFTEMPTGFSMELAKNNAAMDAYASMGPEAKEQVLEKARAARSRWEMQQVVYTLANSPL